MRMADANLFFPNTIFEYNKRVVKRVVKVVKWQVSWPAETDVCEDVMSRW